MRLRTVPTVTTAALALALAAPAAPALAHDASVDKVVMKTVLAPSTVGTTNNMDFVKNLPYKSTGAAAASGSDIEFGRIGGRDYAFAGTLRNGLQIADITDPAKAEIVSVYDCQISQGDVQVFKQGSRVLATYTADGSIGAAGLASTCAKDLIAKGTALTATSAGTVLVDVTNPAKPTTVGWAPVTRGSHNMTVHPSGNFLYNSNSDLITSTNPAIIIFDISDPAKPKQVKEYALPFIPLSLGSESHDITFNETGTRAYSAALSQTLVLDTSDPANPKPVSQILDPTVQVSHGADPITLTKKDGSKRTFLVVSDEQAGAAAGTNCPGGGLHFYDITGELEKAPAKVATWFIGESKPSTATCTAHVFRMHSEQELITVAWYDQGVRVLDLDEFADQAGSRTTVLRGTQGGIKEIGGFVFEDANTWSFKTNKIATDGSFFGYGNDLGRGLDVYRFRGLGRTVPALEPVELLASPGNSGGNGDKGNNAGQGSGTAQGLSGTNAQLLSGGPVAGLGLLTLLGAALRRRATR